MKIIKFAKFVDWLLQFFKNDPKFMKISHQPDELGEPEDLVPIHHITNKYYYDYKTGLTS